MSEVIDEDVNVLFIEDDPAVAEMYKLKLELDGYRVTVAKSGEEGLDHANSQVPDIVFLDIRLPKMDGFAVLEDLGLIEPYRTATNRRRYSQRNVRKLQVIQQLTREKGVNLAGVKYILMLLESLKTGGVKPPDDLKQVYDLYEEII